MELRIKLGEKDYYTIKDVEEVFYGEGKLYYKLNYGDDVYHEVCAGLAHELKEEE